MIIIITYSCIYFKSPYLSAIMKDCKWYNNILNIDSTSFGGTFLCGVCVFCISSSHIRDRCCKSSHGESFNIAMRCPPLRSYTPSLYCHLGIYLPAKVLSRTLHLHQRASPCQNIEPTYISLYIHFFLYQISHLLCTTFYIISYITLFISGVFRNFSQVLYILFMDLPVRRATFKSHLNRDF